MKPFDLDIYMSSHLPLVIDALEQYTPAATTPPESLHEAMRYALMNGGKRVRPLLCLAACESVGGNPEMVLPMASALEMIHAFSLIHDDLPAIDNDDFRRGIPTVHRKFGEAMAILAGDALHTLAFSTIAKHQTADDPHRIVRVIALLAEASGSDGMVGGQVDDIYYERRPVTAEILRHIHARKTGALLSAAILSGAILAGADSAAEIALCDYGKQIGLAFQIVDDVLDVVGDDAKLGKQTGSDEKNDKATYPKVFGIEMSIRLAREAADAAVASLQHFGESANPLRGFARFIVEREF